LFLTTALFHLFISFYCDELLTQQSGLTELVVQLVYDLTLKSATKVFFYCFEFFDRL